METREPGAAELRLILVDDSSAFLEVAQRFFAMRAGVTILAMVTSGQEALAAVARLRPDLVVIDMLMPAMGGLEATRRMKADPAAPRVIVVTAFDSLEYREAAAAAGADGFLPKSKFLAAAGPLIDALFPARRAPPSET